MVIWRRRERAAHCILETTGEEKVGAMATADGLHAWVPGKGINEESLLGFHLERFGGSQWGLPRGPAWHQQREITVFLRPCGDVWGRCGSAGGSGNGEGFGGLPLRREKHKAQQACALGENIRTLVSPQWPDETPARKSSTGLSTELKVRPESKNSIHRHVIKGGEGFS